MIPRRIAAGVELVFAFAIVLSAIARPSLWHAAQSARLVLVLEAGCAAVIACALLHARPWSWPAALALSIAGVVQLWYISAAFVFSYMGEGMADHAGLLILMGTFALQAGVVVLWTVQKLAARQPAAQPS